VPDQEVIIIIIIIDQRGLGRGCAKRCQVRKLKREDAMDHSRWKKWIKDN